ncbi:MAG: serine O-acetyltransferase EpsC [Erysipelotrichaceae bacterium]
MSLKAELRYNIARVRSVDHSTYSNAEVLWLYPHIKALVFHHFAHRLYLHKHYFAARWLSNVARNWTGIEIHPGATIGKGLFIDHGMGVVIGETAIIGDDCIIFHGVTIGASGKPSVKGERRHPKIGNRVMVGAHALVLGGIEIGDDTTIGANAVVTKDAPNGVTLIGMPAKSKS